MPKFSFLLLSLVFIFPSVTLAKVEVSISNNMDGSSNRVNVNSRSSTNQPSTKNSVNQTDIVINNNGEVKEYHGDGEGNIELKSSDGKSTVSVNNNSATNTPSQSPNSTVNTKTNITVNSKNSDSSPSAKPEATVAGIFKETKQKTQTKSGFWAYFKKEISELFKLFS